MSYGFQLIPKLLILLGQILNQIGTFVLRQKFATRHQLVLFLFQLSLQETHVFVELVYFRLVFVSHCVDQSLVLKRLLLVFLYIVKFTTITTHLKQILLLITNLVRNQTNYRSINYWFYVKLSSIEGEKKNIICHTQIAFSI